ncbi:hypothetical protein KC345_g81 [Hortaea werneckii]|nr:hypothetical protein KC345_g81 [Hortaea werneckii]
MKPPPKAIGNAPKVPPSQRDMAAPRPWQRRALYRRLQAPRTPRFQRHIACTTTPAALAPLCAVPANAHRHSMNSMKHFFDVGQFKGSCIRRVFCLNGLAIEIIEHGKPAKSMPNTLASSQLQSTFGS